MSEWVGQLVSVSANERVNSGLISHRNIGHMEMSLGFKSYPKDLRSEDQTSYTLCPFQ